MNVKLVRAAHFSAGHTYGATTAPDGFGHNFRVEASFAGPVDPMTGMIANLGDVDAWMKKVLSELDHHYLNDDVEYFRKHVPTVENIAVYIFGEIKKQIVGSCSLASVRVYEGIDRWVDYSG